MSDNLTMTKPPKRSAMFKARMAGAFWLLTFVMSMFAMIIGERLVVYGDAAATATNILAHVALFRSATAALLVSAACYLVATVFVYELLKPVSGTVSLLAAFFSLVGCVIGAVGCLFDLIPLLLLQGEHAAAFTSDQLQALAFVFLKVRRLVNDDIGLVFFGLHCLLIGYLVLRSTFLPRLIGLLLVVAGFGWLTFLVPPLATSLAPYNMLPGAIGELAWVTWLMAKGVNVGRWNEQFSSYRGELANVALLTKEVL